MVYIRLGGNRERVSAMDKRPVKFNLAEWLILTDLVRANPRKFQDKDHKGTDVYSLSKLKRGCSKQVPLDNSPKDRQLRSLVTKLEGYTKEGHRYVEFKSFDGPDDGGG